MFRCPSFAAQPKAAPFKAKSPIASCEQIARRAELLGRLLSPWNLGAFFAGFRESDRNGLLAALHRATLAAAARLERASFFTVHGALHALTGGFPVLAPA